MATTTADPAQAIPPVPSPHSNPMETPKSTKKDFTIFTTTNERLSMFFPIRMTLALAISSVTGFSLGAAHGGNMAGLVFRAENAHRLPTSTVGWYLYHKSKNYHVMLGGIKEGMRMGLRLGVWTGIFLYMEEAVDRLRGAVLKRWVGFKDRRGLERELGLERLENLRGVWVQRDFLSTTVAALGTAGAFSVWNRMPINTAARTATLALKAGLGFGLVQDALSVIRGRRVGYVEYIRQHVLGGSEKATEEVIAS